MIGLTCRYVSLVEINDLKAVEVYQELVRPLSYEFGLERHALYVAIGLKTRTGTPWLYVASVTGDPDLQLVPAILFIAEWREIPSAWELRIGANGEVDLLSRSLARAESWFERYLSEDPQIVGVVKSEIDLYRNAVRGG